jgi:electron transfer flavoprotein beta subunit
MSNAYHIVVCAGVVPDPLQTLEPITSATGPALKNEMMLPAVLDPWAAHALYEAAHLTSQVAGSKLWLVSAAPKVKLQQVMMNVAQKAAFELVPIDAPANGFADAHAVAEMLAGAVQSIVGLDRSRLLLFGGWESASRGAGVTMQLVAEQFGIIDQFQGVDRLAVQEDGSFEILERIEGGRHLVSICQGPPVLLGWATGSLPEPRNNPQIGMANIRAIMPALQKTKPAGLPHDAVRYLSVTPPKQQRQTRIVKDQTPDEIAAELLQWIAQD